MDMQRTDLSSQPTSLFNSRACKKVGAISALFVTSLFYQNFSFADGWNMNLIPVNEHVRASHARELLGSNYSGSPAERVENASTLGMAIFNDVYNNLPVKFKNSAISLSTTILTEAEKRRVDPVLVMAIIKTESAFNPLARGSHGEIGLMQLKPATAEWIANKYNIPWRGPKTLENPKMNVRIGLAYLDYLRGRFGGHANKYLSAYNMGIGTVSRLYSEDKTPREYSQKVMKNYRAIYRRLAAATTLSLVAGN